MTDHHHHTPLQPPAHAATWHALHAAPWATALSFQYTPTTAHQFHQGFYWKEQLSGQKYVDHHGSCACSSHFASGTAQHNKKRTSQLGLSEIERTSYCFNYCYTIVTLHNWKDKIPFVRKIAGQIFNVIQQVLSTKKVYGPWDLRKR